MITVRRIIHLFIIVCSIGLGILTLTGFLGGFAYLFELTSHFRLQYALGLIPLIIGFIILKNRIGATATGILLLINIFQVIQFASPFQGAMAGEKRYENEWTILQMNVHASNRYHEGVIQYIKKMDPDILALEEINYRWFEALKDILKDYPHRKFVIREDNFGIGLFSRVPTEEIEIKYFEESGVPSVLAKLKAGDETVSLLFTHPLPPGGLGYFHRRNKQLNDIAKERDKYGKNLIVIGDLNATPWSHYFKKFKRDMNLKDTRKGFGIHNTWPTQLPIMLIPLDHCLVSEGITTLDRRIGPNIGSDHYPVFVRLGL